MRNKTLAVMALFLLAFAVSTGAHANGFAFLWQRTNERMESNPVVTVMANTFDNDEQLREVWSIDQPELQDVCYGDRFQLVLAASAKSIVGKDRKADEFIRKYGVKAEWYRPADTGGVPYRYDRSAQAQEFNRLHRLPPSDPTDGDSPAKVSFYPAKVLNWNTYVQGANVKTPWLRIVNGARLAKELELLGLFRFTTVDHDDIWIPIQVAFVASPVERGMAHDMGESRQTVSDNVAKINGLVADLQSRDIAIWDAYCAGQKVQDARISEIEKCLGEIKGALGDLTIRDDELLKLVIANNKRNDWQDARLDRLETAWEQFRASAQATTGAGTQGNVRFIIAFVRHDKPICVEYEGNDNGKTRVVTLSAGKASFMDEGLPEGPLTFRYRLPGGAWRDYSLTVTQVLQGTIKTIEVN